MKTFLVLLSASVLLFPTNLTVEATEAESISSEIESLQKQLEELETKDESSDNEEKTMAEKLEEDPVIIDHDDFTLQVKDIWLEQDAETYEGTAIVFEYEYTNKTDEPVGNNITWDFYTDILQDNDDNMINTLDWVPNKKYGHEEYGEVKPGGKSMYADAYLLDDEITPVTVEVFDFLTGEDIDEWEFELEDLELRENENENELTEVENSTSSSNSVPAETSTTETSGEAVQSSESNSQYISKEHDSAYREYLDQAIEDSLEGQVEYAPGHYDYPQDYDMSEVYGDNPDPELNNGYHNEAIVPPYDYYEEPASYE